ncbi:MAG: alanine racemase [Actinomycetota bacterium]|nr:alanine racemase [Actinomycetota bacterium]MDP2287335.1 alanine racemase [Actinomycetota bacterium]
MTFTLEVSTEQWRAHVHTVSAMVKSLTGASIVPVIKGNGYGLGQARLARESNALQSEAVAVGSVFELDEVLSNTDADVVVLEPFEPRDLLAGDVWWEIAQKWDARRVIRTISSTSGLASLSSGSGNVRVLLEARTSMNRFGFSESELGRALADPLTHAAIASHRLQICGVTLHLPLEQSADEESTPGEAAVTARVHEVQRWHGLWQTESAKLGTVADQTLWLSHLSDNEYSQLQASNRKIQMKARIGTRLWLGDRSALNVYGVALAVHPLPDGTHVGYRQRSGPTGGTLVVVSGGTSHGIGLSAPTPASSLRQRIVTVGTGALDAAGRALSPFIWEGKQRWFAEPPHQHHSMIWLPRGCVVPQVGDQFRADVRFTTSRFDVVRGMD